MTGRPRAAGRPTDRAGVRRSLVATGMEPDLADRWCDLWETEAARQHMARNGDYFWDAAKGWIDAHVAALMQSGRTTTHT